MSRRVAVASVLLMSCGSKGGGSPTVPSEALDKKSPPVAESTTKPSSDSPTGTPAPPPALSDLTPEAACARYDVLAGEGCAWTQRFPPEFRNPGNCVGSLRTWVAPETPQHEKLQHTLNCWALDCEAAAACMVRIQATSAPPPPRNCGEEGTAAVLVDAGTWAARRGATAKRFSDVKTTAAEPIEVCGIEGELEWMTRVVCNNGSNPYGSQEVAHDSRDAWVERGGRCNSILDRYSVRCPEATYQVHVDRYICPRDK
jgi:hypothetical protein